MLQITIQTLLQRGHALADFFTCNFIRINYNVFDIKRLLTSLVVTLFESIIDTKRTENHV